METISSFSESWLAMFEWVTSAMQHANRSVVEQQIPALTQFGGQIIRSDVSSGTERMRAGVLHKLEENSE